MAAILVSLASLLFGAFILMVGNSLLGIAVPLRMTGAGFSTEITGLIMTAYFAGLLTGSIYGQRIIARVGHVRTFAGLAAIITASALALPLVFDAFAWALLRFSAGVSIAGLFAVMESWLNERSGNENRGQVLGVYMVNHYVAIVAGQLLVNVYTPEGIEVFIAGAMLTCLSLVPTSLTRIQAPEITAIKPLSFAALYRASPLGVVASGASGLMMGAFWGLGAVYATALGFSVFEVTLFTVAVVIGGLISQWPIGRLSDRFDRRTVLFWVLVTTAFVCAAGVPVSLASGIKWPVIALGAAMGAGISAVYPIAVAQTFDYIERASYIAASSGLLLAYAIGATVGPLVVSVIMAHAGPLGFFAFQTVSAVGLAGFVVHRMRARAPLPLDQQSETVPVTRMSPVVCELDPRTEPQEAAPRDLQEEVA